jgi:hypothetical protein
MIYICKESKIDRFLEKYILDYIDNNSGVKIIGIDFEFNRVNNVRQIALCQINFTINSKSDIFLFYPPNIDINIFRKLLISDNIIKILHGSESLDIPYLYDNIIGKADRNKFCKNFFDTRYMCEYYNATNKIINGKCRIYDLLLQMKVITPKRYDDLMKNDKMMGNIWDIFIDVRKLSNELAKYSIYDVLYLPQLYKAFPKNDIYKYIIPGIANLNFNLRYEKQLDVLFTNISQHNLTKYMLNQQLNQMLHISFNEIYIMCFGYLLTNEIFDNLYKINYFRKFIEVIVKNILYNVLDSHIKLFKFDFMNTDANTQFVQFIKTITHMVNELFIDM